MKTTAQGVPPPGLLILIALDDHDGDGIEEKLDDSLRIRVESFRVFVVQGAPPFSGTTSESKAIMTIKSQCPGCARVYTLDESKAGLSLRCKDCRETIEVPSLKPISPSRPKPRPPASPKPAKKSRPEPEEEEEYGALPPRINTGDSRRSAKKRRSSGSGFRIRVNWGLISTVFVFLIIAMCAGLLVPAVRRARQSARMAAEKQVVWSNFAFPNGKFSCDMPQGTVYEQKNHANGSSTVLWKKELQRMVVTAGFTDTSSIPDWQLNPEAGLTEVQQFYITSLDKSVTVVSQSSTMIQGHPAREFVVNVKGQLTVHHHYIYANSRLIEMQIAYPLNNEPPDAKRAFQTLVIE